MRASGKRENVFSRGEAMTSAETLDATRTNSDQDHPFLARMRNLAWLTVALAGLVMIIGGAFALTQGLSARDQVRDKLVSQQIVTPEDASIPNETVDDEATAESMAEIIGKHAEESAGGLTYSQMGRFASAADPTDPKGTNNADEAMKDARGNPSPNSARNTAFQASALQTSLYTSVMAFNVAKLVIGLGLAFIALGVGCWAVGVPLVWTVTRRKTQAG
jgi:hypothetical protein